VGDPDDGYYNNLPIGFTFRFRGVNYTTVAASTNGFLLLGQVGKADTPGYTNNLATGGNATATTLIAPLWDDLSLASGGLRTDLSGTAPNRVFTVEWRNVKWDLNASGANMNFQVKLYENTNAVQFVYDRIGVVLNNASASIGLMGATNDFISVSGLPAEPVVSTTTADNAIDRKPLNNRVFTFTPARKLYDFGSKVGTYTALTTAPATLSGGDADEGYYNGIAIGFSFQFRGVSYTTISASTNGLLTFNQNLSGGDFTNDLGGYADGMALPTVLAPLWDDLSLAAGGFRTSVTGTAPNRVFTAEWYNARWQYNAPLTSLSFQVKLFEGSNRVWYLYSPTTNALTTPSASIGFNDGGYFHSLSSTGTAPTSSTAAATDNLSARPVMGQVYAFAPTSPISGPLPVELVSFVAKRSTSSAAALAWVTASEKNNAGFVVEKSSNGLDFKEIGFVEGAGSSSQQLAYTYLDADARTAAYYRLKQQDTDGGSSYSPVQFVAAPTGKAEALLAYPNPARGSVQVLNLQPGTPLTLTDALGRPVRTYNNPEGSLDLSGIAAGLYWLRTPSQQVRLSVE